jgi:glycosyltransferase involved in cell wall biosynthesis
LNGLDLLVLPSLETKHWTELFGRILVEAMACEVPVIASRSGGIPEVLGDAGVLVEPGNRLDLASAIDRLCADPSARCELGLKGRKRAVECFDVPVVARILGRDIMEIISSIAAEKNRA